MGSRLHFNRVGLKGCINLLCQLSLIKKSKLHKLPIVGGKGRTLQQMN